MTVVHRAARRANIPVRFSGGFHPAPRISFPDALPTGVESEAEIIDVELFQPWTARQTVEAFNAELPTGFRVLEGVVLPWRSPSSAASTEAVVYELTLPEAVPADLAERVAELLAAETRVVEKLKSGKPIAVDLRRELRGLELEPGILRMTLGKGSPTLLAAHLLDLDQEQTRDLRIRKVATLLRETAVEQAGQPL